MENNEFVKIVPPKLLLWLLPAIVAMCVGPFAKGSVFTWCLIVGYSSLLIFAAVATPYLYKAKDYPKLMGVWFTVILSIIPVFLRYLA